MKLLKKKCSKQNPLSNGSYIITDMVFIKYIVSDVGLVTNLIIKPWIAVIGFERAANAPCINAGSNARFGGVHLLLRYRQKKKKRESVTKKDQNETKNEKKRVLLKTLSSPPNLPCDMTFWFRTPSSSDEFDRRGSWAYRVTVIESSDNLSCGFTMFRTRLRIFRFGLLVRTSFLNNYQRQGKKDGRPKRVLNYDE